MFDKVWGGYAKSILRVQALAPRCGGFRFSFRSGTSGMILPRPHQEDELFRHDFG